MYGFRGTPGLYSVDCTKSPFLEMITESSNRQKAPGQHGLQASNSQDSVDWVCSVSHGQEPVLWHLEEELEKLANCTLENDKPLEHSKARLLSKRKVVYL